MTFDRSTFDRGTFDREAVEIGGGAPAAGGMKLVGGVLVNNSKTIGGRLIAMILVCLMVAVAAA